MQGSLQKQPQIKILPAFSVNKRLGLQEADINDVVKTVQGVLPQHIDEDIDVTITLLEKNLKIMAELARMKEALTHLVRNVMDAMPGCGNFSLTIKQFNYEIESLLKCDDAIMGACAFISLAGGGVVEQIKEKIIKPCFTIKTYGKDLGLAIAYRITKRRVRQGEEANIYLPLTKWEIVNMMSIPVG